MALLQWSGLVLAFCCWITTGMCLSLDANEVSKPDAKSDFLSLEAFKSRLAAFKFSTSGEDEIVDRLFGPYGDNSDCSCPRPHSCGCCARIDYTVLHAVACANFTVDPQADTLNIVLTYNGRVIKNETLSAENPPPICQGLYYVASWCTILTNLSFSSQHFGGCLRYELRILQKVILTIPVGCFYWPAQVNPVTGVKVNPLIEANVSPLGNPYKIPQGSGAKFRPRVLTQKSGFQLPLARGSKRESGKPVSFGRAVFRSLTNMGK